MALSIHVGRPSGHLCTVHLSEEAGIAELRVSIESSESAPVGSYRLVHGTQELTQLDDLRLGAKGDSHVELLLLQCSAAELEQDVSNEEEDFVFNEEQVLFMTRRVMENMNMPFRTEAGMRFAVETLYDMRREGISRGEGIEADHPTFLELIACLVQRQESERARAREQLEQHRKREMRQLACKFLVVAIFHLIASIMNYKFVAAFIAATAAMWVLIVSTCIIGEFRANSAAERVRYLPPCWINAINNPVWITDHIIYVFRNRCYGYMFRLFFFGDVCAGVSIGFDIFTGGSAVDNCAFVVVGLALQESIIVRCGYCHSCIKICPGTFQAEGTR